MTRKSFYQAGQDSFTLAPAQNPDMFQVLNNIEPVNQGPLRRRRGYQLLANPLPLVPFREGYSFRSESLNLKSMVWTAKTDGVNAGNVLAVNEDGSAYLNSIFTPSLTAAFAPRMVLSRNYGYFADGAPSDYLKWDGTSTPGNLTNWGIDINNVTGLTAGPNAPGTATDLGASGTTGSQGPNLPSSGTNAPIASGPFAAPPYNGGTAWVNPGNITGNDGVAATSQPIGAFFPWPTQYLKATGFGFTVPVGATITGIVVVARILSNSYTDVADQSVLLYKAGVLAGTDHSIGVWPTVYTNRTYGSSSDLWGTTWTPAEINNAGFGFALSARNNGLSSVTASVDYVSITVYYTAPSVGSWTNPNNIKVQDGAVATAVATTSPSSELQATNFGLTAAGVPIGIQVEIKLSTSSGSPTISTSLTKNSLAYGSRKISTVINTSLGFITLGGPLDLWNGVWSLADINSATFGTQFFVLTASGAPTVSVDFVRITVFSSVGPPTIAIVGTGITLLSGTVYTVAFQNSVTGHVSHFTPFSTNTGPLTNQGILVSNIPVSLDSQVDQKLILRPADGADTTTLYLVASIANATTTYQDGMTDATLLTQPIFQQTNQDGTLHGIANNKRPPLLNFPTKHKGRIYGSIQSTLYWSKNLDEVLTSTGTITSKWEEAWPSTNQMDISEAAETIQGIMSDGETLWIGTERCIRRLIGDSPSNFQKPEIQFNETGILNQDCWKIVFSEGEPVGSMWLTPDSRVMISDFNSYHDIGTPIQDILNTLNTSIDSLTKLSTTALISHACFVSKGPAEYYMLYVPTGVNTGPDIMCVYSLRSKKWCIWKPTDFITASLFFIDGKGAPRWTFAATAGPLYEWIETIFQDRVNNTPLTYTATAQTSWLDFGDEGLTKAFNKVIVTTSDPGLTIGVQGAIRDVDLDTGGIQVVAPSALSSDIFGDLFLADMVSKPGFYKWYQLTFTSPTSGIADILDGFDLEIMPSMRM